MRESHTKLHFVTCRVHVSVIIIQVLDVKSNNLLSFSQLGDNYIKKLEVKNQRIDNIINLKKEAEVFAKGDIMCH